MPMFPELRGSGGGGEDGAPSTPECLNPSKSPLAAVPLRMIQHQIGMERLEEKEILVSRRKLRITIPAHHIERPLPAEGGEHILAELTDDLPALRIAIHPEMRLGR